VPFDDPFKAVAMGLRGGAAQLPARAKPAKDNGQPAKKVRNKADRRSTVVEARPTTAYGEVVGALVVFSPTTGPSAQLWRTGRFTIGRDPDNDLVVEDPRVSAFHAIIRAEPGRAFLLDTSTNGTEVAGTLLQADRAAIADGSVVEVGDVLIVVQILATDTLDVVRSSGS